MAHCKGIPKKRLLIKYNNVIKKNAKPQFLSWSLFPQQTKPGTKKSAPNYRNEVSVTPLPWL